jgi:hypothetical protein
LEYFAYVKGIGSGVYLGNDLEKKSSIIREKKNVYGSPESFN